MKYGDIESRFEPKDAWKIKEVKNFLKWKERIALREYFRRERYITRTERSLKEIMKRAQQDPENEALRNHVEATREKLNEYKSDLTEFKRKAAVYRDHYNELIDALSHPNFDLENVFMPAHNLAINNNFELVETAPTYENATSLSGALSATSPSSLFGLAETTSKISAGAATMLTQAVTTTLTALVTASILHQTFGAHDGAAYDPILPITSANNLGGGGCTRYTYNQQISHQPPVGQRASSYQRPSYGPHQILQGQLYTPHYPPQAHYQRYNMQCRWN